MNKSYASSSRIQSDSICNFIEKTYEILECKDNEVIISWSPKGTSFVVRDVLAFSNNILPKYFKHSNFSSFVRQLNMYNFHKVRGDKLENEFEHNKFKKGHRELLSQIRRKGNEQTSSVAEIDKSPLEEKSELPRLMSMPSKLNTDDDHWNEADEVDRNLELLANENRKLKREKNKLIVLRKELLDSENLVDDKFYKFITTLIAHKVKQKLGLSKSLINLDHLYSLQTFKSIMGHLVSPEKALSYEYYDVYSKMLLERCREEAFMAGAGEEGQMEQIPSIEFIVESGDKI